VAGYTEVAIFNVSLYVKVILPFSHGMLM
jgi:hypothetical protein